MKKYIISDGRMFSINDNDFSTLQVNRSDYIVDYNWIIKEDGEVYYEGNTYPVVAGDIAFLLYARYKNDDIRRELVIVHNDKFLEVLTKNEEYDNEQRKKHSCCDCENCKPCCGDCPA